MGVTFTAIFQNKGSDISQACKKLTEIMLDTQNQEEIWRWKYRKRDCESPECIQIHGQLEFQNARGFHIELGKHFFMLNLLIGWYTLLEDERLQNRLRQDLSRFSKRFGPAIYLPSSCEVDAIVFLQRERTWEDLRFTLSENCGNQKKSLKELLACINRGEKQCGYYVELF
ncbi:hypothetical protein [Cohnella boryungensis]|uniref:Uncharacterized protein n=1 Tax=Cohnella boryungensis TaxID=768479 RepID=A0ABV8SEW3_9BACL